MTVKAVLFDIDGTLVDSNDLHVRAWQEAFSAGGFHIEAAAIRAQIGKGTDMLVPTLIPGANPDLIEALGTAHGEVFKLRYLAQVKPFPHARDLLARTHDAGKTIVLASSASAAELDYYLAFLDIRDLVGRSTTSDDVEKSKPAPDIFAVALKKIAPVSASGAIVIGDTPYDIEAARKCGMASIGVLSGGFPARALADAGAGDIYDDVAAILEGFEDSPLAA